MHETLRASLGLFGLLVLSPLPAQALEVGTITDNLTGLIWLKDGGCIAMRPWLGALAAVDGLQDGPNIPQTAWTIRIFEDGYQDRAVKSTDPNLVIAARRQLSA